MKILMYFKVKGLGVTVLCVFCVTQYVTISISNINQSVTHLR
jgi:hypothetical protein